MLHFEKSTPSPGCLVSESKRTSGDYKCGDVIERIKKDFNNKCYLCGDRAPNTINVEHFRPHRGDKKLKFNWENLFYSCAHCNNTKLDDYEDIIDCTKSSEKVEERIKLTMVDFPKENVIVENLDDRKETISTVSLLKKIYNGETVLKAIESDNIRQKISEDISDFKENVLIFLDLKSVDRERDRSLVKIKFHLSKASSFTAFKRSFVRDNPNLYLIFKKYFD